MAQQKCLKCGGLVELEAIFDESFKRMPTIRCYNCGTIEYPPQLEPCKPPEGRSPFHQEEALKRRARVLVDD